MAKVHVQTTINGESVEYLCEAQQSLLEVLRENLGLTGTKEGCLTGDCGACTVNMDGRIVCSCLVFAVEAVGSEISTIEGVAHDQTLHPVQEQLLEHAGLQCGICTPGVVMAAKSLLEQNDNPTEQEIRYYISGNLCRCTGYDKIVRAIQAAAEQVRAQA
jgi:carbon-monoxide dehydrogenase small subunit